MSSVPATHFERTLTLGENISSKQREIAEIAKGEIAKMEREIVSSCSVICLIFSVVRNDINVP